MIAKYHVLNKKVIIFSLGPQRAAAVHCILQEGGENVQLGKKPLTSRLEPFPLTCVRLLSMEESDWILRKMKAVKCHKMMKKKMDLHLEFNRQPHDACFCKPKIVNLLDD